MWHAVALALAFVINLVVANFPTAGDGSGGGAAAIFNALPAPAIQAIVGGFAIFGLFIDLNVLFSCIAIALTWKGVWFAVRIWRIILELIPFAA